MLAYHLEWHLRQALAPLLFHDTDIVAARATRASAVERTEPSPSAKAKKGSKLNADGLPVMSFGDLMDHLATLARNTLAAEVQKGHTFILHTKPTRLQEAAFKLLEIDPTRVQ